MRGPHSTFLILAVLAFWLGGLTFYAAVVVPIGNRTLGSDVQGRVTQQVTNYLNVAGVAAAAVLLWRALDARYRWLLVVAATLLALQLALYTVHRQLDAMLAESAAGESSAGDFYSVHRVYLLLTAAQWLTGLAALWLVVAPSRKPDV